MACSLASAADSLIGLGVAFMSNDRMMSRRPTLLALSVMSLIRGYSGSIAAGLTALVFGLSGQAPGLMG